MGFLARDLMVRRARVIGILPFCMQLALRRTWGGILTTSAYEALS